MGNQLLERLRMWKEQQRVCRRVTVLAVSVQVYTELFLLEAVFKAAHTGLFTKSTTKSKRRNCLMSLAVALRRIATVETVV
jgi:hypothetical protein